MKRFPLLLFLLAGTLAAQTHNNVFSWTAATTGDAPTGYHVWRATGASLTAACAALPAPGAAVPTGAAYATVTAPTSTYTDTAAVAGQNTCYEVSAFNTGGESALSASASGTTPFQKPGVPTGVSVVSQ
jgi:hypothetical protein